MSIFGYAYVGLGTEGSRFGFKKKTAPAIVHGKFNDANAVGQTVVDSTFTPLPYYGQQPLPASTQPKVKAKKKEAPKDLIPVTDLPRSRRRTGPWAKSSDLIRARFVDTKWLASLSREETVIRLKNKPGYNGFYTHELDHLEVNSPHEIVRDMLKVAKTRDQLCNELRKRDLMGTRKNYKGRLEVEKSLA